MPSQPSEIHTPEADDANEAAFAKRGCCFWIPCFNSNPSRSLWWERIGNAENSGVATSNQDSLLVRGWNRVREWSELVAGPKWKTFIRRFNKNNNRNGFGGRPGKFQYDPSSYALNFDEGSGQNSHFDDDIMHRDFSARYAFLAMPSSTKSSMDLGKDPPFFT